MPCLKKLRKAAKERERKKKLLRALADPLAWTYLDPWRNPQVIPPERDADGERNELELHNSAETCKPGGSQIRNRSEAASLEINPSTSASENLEPDGSQISNPQNDVNVLIHPLTGSGMPTVWTPHLSSVPSSTDWQTRDTNSFNAEMVPIEADADEVIREVAIDEPRVPDIVLNSANEILMPSSSPRTTASGYLQPEDSQSYDLEHATDEKITPPSMPVVRSPEGTASKHLEPDGTQSWELEHTFNEKINPPSSSSMLTVWTPQLSSVQSSTDWQIQDANSCTAELQESTALNNAARCIWSTSNLGPVVDTFSDEDLSEIDLPDLTEPSLECSTASSVNASFGSNKIQQAEEPPVTLCFWQQNKLISLSRSPLRIIELPGAPQNVISADCNVNSSGQISNTKSNPSVDPDELCQTPIKQWKKLEGRRIVDYDYFTKWLVLSQAAHSKSCDGILCPCQEDFKSMISTLWLKCNICDEVLRGYSEDPSVKYSLRYSVTWAIPNCGTTYTCMNEIFSFLNMPFLDRNTFAKDELQMHKVIDAALEESLDTAIEEEKSIVKEEMRQKGMTIEENAPIESCAEVDGSWGQRSNGHRYSSASGCAVIVGVRSKKVCFVGCRNKRCAVCSRNQKLGKNKKRTKHKCFRNFFGASGGMEPDIAIEGFEKLHRKGLKITTVVTDGDCTTVAKIKNSCKYGHEIKHQLCCNHSLKSLGKKLREIKVPKTYRDLVPKAIDRITGGMRGAIAHCASSNDVDKVEQLRLDLTNAPYHAFGIHYDCRQYFCNKKTKAEDLEFFEKLKATSIWEKIMAAVESVAAKAEFLCENRTSNLAENVFCQLCKFNVGKRVNTMSRGSYEMRVKITVLHKNDKYNWHTKYMEMFVGTAPGYWLRKMFRAKEGSRRRTNASRSRPGYCRKKAKSSTKPEEDCDYGQVAVQRMDERTTNNEIDKSKIRALYVLTAESNEILKNSINLSTMEAYAKGRILTKFAPEIVCAQTKTLAKKAELMLQNMHNYNLLKSNNASVGRILRLVESDLNLKLRGTKFFVDQCHNYLCCAPDAISGDNQTILLIRKLPKTKFDPISPDKNSKIEAQTALHTCRASKCIVYYIHGTQNSPIGHHTIIRDNEYFSKHIASKLELFFEEHLINHVFTQNMEIKK